MTELNRVDHYSTRCMHDPSFMDLALIVSETMTKRKNLTKVYAADDDDDAGKAIHMSRFCFAGETKIGVLGRL